jgi:hypothetical protein
MLMRRNQHINHCWLGGNSLLHSLYLSGLAITWMNVACNNAAWMCCTDNNFPLLNPPSCSQPLPIDVPNALLLLVDRLVSPSVTSHWWPATYLAALFSGMKLVSPALTLSAVTGNIYVCAPGYAIIHYTVYFVRKYCRQWYSASGNIHSLYGIFCLWGWEDRFVSVVDCAWLSRTCMLKVFEGSNSRSSVLEEWLEYSGSLQGHVCEER